MKAVLLSLALLAQQASPAVELSSYVQKVTAEDGTITVQTGTRRLTAEGKPDVWLVGVVHVGEANYYKEIQAILDERDVVLYEGVKPPKDAPVKTPEQIKAEKDQEKGLYTTFGEVLGLEFQNAHITYKNPNWINSDLSWDEMNELNKNLPEGASPTFGMVQQLMDPKSPMAATVSTFLKSPIPGLQEALKVFFVKMLGDPNASKTISNDPGFSQVILGARNESAQRHFDEVLKRSELPKSVAIFYGAAHHPGIEAHLVKTYGYKVAETKWLSAAHANPSTLSEPGKRMLETLEKSVPTGGGAKTGGGLMAAFNASKQD